MQYGYTGKILFVDLTSGEIKEETPSDQIYREYIGGTGRFCERTGRRR